MAWVNVGQVGRRLRLLLPEPDQDGYIDLSAPGGEGGPHSHVVADTTALQTALDAKAAVHTHPFAATIHGHAIADSTGLQDALDAKSPTHTHPYAATVHVHVVADVTGLQAALDGKSATHSHPYAATTHGHAISDTTGLQAALDGKAATHTHPYAATVHVHAIADTTGLQAALDGKAASSHGTHLALGTTAGTAAEGNHGHAGGSAPVYLDIGATLALALATNDVVKATPTATGTFTTTVPNAGLRKVVIVVQSNTTAKTMTFGTGFKPAATLVLGTTAARQFSVEFVSDGTNLIEVGRSTVIVT